jgi:two-component system LytT family response regulator
MNKITCIIVDDENSGRIVLKELLKENFTEIEVLGEAANIIDAFEIINRTSPDLVFLDIQMPGGNGFELLQKFDPLNFEVVFVTSYDKYAINAIKFSALDYLLKPIDVEELKISIEKIRKKKDTFLNTSILISNLLTNNLGTDKKIAVHVQDKVKFICVNDIVCIEAFGNYSTVFCSDNTKHTTPKLLKDFEEFLEETPVFIRINRSTIINISCIKSYTKGEICNATLSNNMQYEISRRKKIEINAILNNKFL